MQTNQFWVGKVGDNVYMHWRIVRWDAVTPELTQAMERFFATERVTRRMLGKQVLGDLSKPKIPLFGSVIFFHVDCFDELTNLVELYK